MTSPLPLIDTRNKTLNNILRHFHKYLTMEYANEIIINQPHKVRVDIKGERKYFEDENISLEVINHFISILASEKNEKFDKSHPYLNTSIPFSGYRVTAEHISVLHNQDCELVIRIPPKKAFDLEDFKISKKLLDENWTYEKIKDLVKEHEDILIIGATASGKTQFLNALLKEIDKKDRLVTIQDALEILHDQEDKTDLAVSRDPNATFSYRHGLDQALRLSPERLILGELDSHNTYTYIRLSNTGHKGGISTLHADDVENGINALAMNMGFGSNLSREDSIEYIASGIDYFIHVQKNRETNEREIVDILKVSDYLKRVNDNKKAIFEEEKGEYKQQLIKRLQSSKVKLEPQSIIDIVNCSKIQLDSFDIMDILESIN